MQCDSIDWDGEAWEKCIISLGKTTHSGWMSSPWCSDVHFVLLGSDMTMADDAIIAHKFSEPGCKCTFDNKNAIL